MKDTIEALRKQVEQKTRETVGEFIKNIPSLIRERLEASAAKVLGFDKDSFGGGWRVDHCNGRSSVISGYVSSRVKKIVHKIMDEVLTEEEIRKILEETKDATVEHAKEEARRAYKEAMMNAIRSRAEEKAMEDANAIFNELDEISTDIELENPACGDDPINSAVMHDIADEVGKE